MSKKAEIRKPKFFFIKIDGNTYNQKFPSFESAHDFFITVQKEMMIDRDMVYKLELFSSSNKSLKEFSKNK